MSSKKDTDLLRELWAPFYFAGASLNHSIVKKLAPAACVSDESATLDTIVQCVESRGEVSSCIRKTLKLIIEEWKDLAPATRAHISGLAQDHQKLFAKLPEILP